MNDDPYSTDPKFPQDPAFKIPSAIPLQIPWNLAEWTGMTLAKLQKDPKLMEFLDAWDRYLRSNNRSDRYMGVLEASLKVSAPTAAELVSRPDFKVLAKPGATERLTNERFLSMIRKSFDLVYPSPDFFPGPVDSLEFIIVIIGYSEIICKTYPNKETDSVKKLITDLYAFCLKHLADAVSHSFSRFDQN